MRIRKVGVDMPDLRKWHLSHSPLRLCFEQHCLELLSLSEYQHALSNLEQWYSNDQAEIIRKFIEIHIKPKWSVYPAFSEMPKILCAEALEHTLALLASRLRSVIDREDPDETLLDHSNEIERIWQVRGKAEKPRSRFGESSWKRSLENILYKQYIDFLLFTISNSKIPEKSTEISKQILLSCIGDILTITKVHYDLDSKILQREVISSSEITDFEEMLSEDIISHVYKFVSELNRILITVSEKDPGFDYIDDLGWIIDKIDNSFLSSLDRNGISITEGNILEYLESLRAHKLQSELFTSTFMETARGYKLLFPLDIRFNSEDDVLDPSLFGFELIDDVHSTGINSELLPKAKTSHLAVVTMDDSLHPEDAANQAIDRIENWLSFLTMNVKHNYYYDLIKYQYTHVNLIDNSCFLHSSTPFYPHIALTKDEYLEVSKWYPVLLEDKRDICLQTLRAIRLFHEATHNANPQDKFIKLWLALECIAGDKGFIKRNWIKTLPIFTSEYQTQDKWDTIRKLSDTDRINYRSELANEVVGYLDYFQRLRSRYFLHPTSTEWNRELLNEVLHQLRAISWNAIAAVSTFLASNDTVTEFTEIAEELRDRW